MTAAPSNHPQNCPDCCLLGQSVPCKRTLTRDGLSLLLKEQCVLWDSSCTGNVATAAQYIFANIELLDEKPCGGHTDTSSSPCTDYELAESLSAMQKLKDWVGKPNVCPAAADTTKSKHPPSIPNNQPWSFMSDQAPLLALRRLVMASVLSKLRMWIPLNKTQYQHTMSKHNRQ